MISPRKHSKIQSIRSLATQPTEPNSEVPKQVSNTHQLLKLWGFVFRFVSPHFVNYCVSQYVSELFALHLGGFFLREEYSCVCALALSRPRLCTAHPGLSVPWSGSFFSSFPVFHAVLFATETFALLA